MAVQAKFRCHSNTEIQGFDGARAVTLMPIYGNGSENASWSKATSAGLLQMTITNPGAFEQFEPGKDYLLNFEPV